MWSYMEQVFPGSHSHRKVVVPGLTHDGAAMYRSNEFKNLLLELFR